MVKNLNEQLEEIQRRAMRSLIVRAAGWCCFVVLLSGIAITAIDFGLKSDELGSRVLLSMTFFVTSSITVLRFWRSIRSASIDDVQTARWVERALPELKNQLSTAVELHQRSNVSGQPFSDLAARTAMNVHETTSRLDLTSVVKSHATYPSIAASLIPILAITILLLTVPRHCYAAAARLIAPWNSIHWPTQHQLSFEPFADQVPINAELRVVVSDRRNRLPRQVQLEIKPTGSRSKIVRTRPMIRLGDRMVADFTDMRESIQIRAIGGDDKYMSWKTVKVVRPPKLQDLKFIATPPAYVADQPFELSDQAQLLVGSIVQVSGESVDSLRSARIEVKTASTVGSTKLTLSNDGRRFFTTMVNSIKIEEDSTLSLQVSAQTKPADFSVAHLQINALEDKPPIVSLQSDMTKNFAVPTGQIAIKANVSDDIGLAHVDVVLSDVTVVRIFDIERRAQESQQLILDVDYLLDFASFTQLQEFPNVEFWLEAEDLKGQRVQSNRVNVTLLSLNDFRRRVRLDEQSFLARLSRISESQKLNIESTRALINNNLTESVVGRLETISKQQENLQAELLDDDRSILNSFHQLSSHLLVNRVPLNTFSRRLQDTERELNATRDRFSEIIEVSIPKLIQFAHMSRAENKQRLEHGLSSLVDNQQQILEAIDNIVSHLDSWDVIQQMAQQLTHVKNEQDRLKVDVDVASREQFAATANHISEARSRTDLLAAQRRVARRFERLLSDTLNWKARKQNDINLTSKLQRVMEHLERGEVGPSMHQAADDLRSMRLIQASQIQAQISKTLKDAIQLTIEAGFTLESSQSQKIANGDPDRSKVDFSSTEDAGAEANRKRLSIDGIKEIRAAQKQVNDATLMILDRISRFGESDDVAKQIEEQNGQQNLIVGKFHDLIQELGGSTLKDPNQKIRTDVNSLDGLLFDGLESVETLTKPELSSDQATDEATGPIVSIMNALLRAARTLESGRVNVALVELQTEILNQLDLLISSQEQAKKLAGGPSPSTGEGSAGNASNQETSNSNSTNEGANVDHQKSRSEFLDEAWGRLPVQVRSFMPDGGSEHFLPGYEKVIADYYRRLAEDE